MNSQTFCLNPTSTYDREALIAPYRNLDYTGYSFCVKIYVHVIRRDDSTGGQSPIDVNEILAKLDSAFNPHQIYFDWDNTIDYIDDTSKYENPSGTIWFENPHDDGVDIYLFDDNEYLFPNIPGAGSSNPEPESSEFYTFGHYLDENNNEQSIAKSYALAHEMGHELFLWHTHHGTDGQPNSGDPNLCPEYPNGSNSSSCGDYVTDTPADPNMSIQGVDKLTCEWLGAVNSPFDPDELNIMSYSYPGCLEYLTFQQSRRMKNAMASLTYLQNLSNYSTAINPCLPPPTPLNYFPNSANQELNLDLTDKPVANYSYVLYDSTGIVVASGESQNVLKTIDTSTLTEGTYFLHFYENGLLTIKQIVVNH